MREPWYTEYERAAGRKRLRIVAPIPDGPPMLHCRDFTRGGRIEELPREWYYRPAPEPPLWRAALEALGEIITAIFRRNR